MLFRSVETWDDVGFRLRGHASLRAAVAGDESPGYKLSFEEFVPDRLFHDTAKLDLLGTESDFTLLRENLALMMERQIGVPAPRTGFALLYVNGEYEGVHPYTEEPDDSTYVYNHFPTGGDLYEAKGYCGDEATLEYRGKDVAAYVATYEPKGRADEESLQEQLIPMLYCASESTDEEFPTCIAEHVDTQEFLDMIALDHVLPDVDGIAGRAHNYLLFHDDLTQRFVVYPWDKDQTFYTWDLSADSTVFDFDLTSDTEVKPVLVDRMQTLLRDDYCDSLRTSLDASDPATLGPEIERLGQLLWDPVWFDPRFTFEDWKNGVQTLIDDQAYDWEETRDEVDASCP